MIALVKSLDKFKSSISVKGAPTPSKPKLKRGESGKIVLDIITKSEKGLSPQKIIELSGLGKGNVSQILTKAKKEGKIESPSRGVYVIVDQKGE